jgi:hypothetical protein
MRIKHWRIKKRDSRKEKRKNVKKGMEREREERKGR